MTRNHAAEPKALRFAAALTGVTGLALAAAAFPPTAGPTRLLADLLIWPLDGTETLAAPETRLGLAISGGVMAGWGALIWQLLGAPYARDPALVIRIILTSLLVWFVVDSTASILAGAALNVVANAAFLLVFLVPILAQRRTVGVTP